MMQDKPLRNILAYHMFCDTTVLDHGNEIIVTRVEWVCQNFFCHKSKSLSAHKNSADY